MPNGSRIEVIAKSPLTGIYGDSNAGGFFGPELKFAGFDMLVIEGRAAEPLYLYLRGGRASLYPAAGIWGQSTGDTQRALRRQVGDARAQVACIGQAGENLVRFAGIQMGSRSAARAGMGAVMGSKNLKAVVASGRGGALEVAEPRRFYDLCMAAQARIRQSEFFPNSSRYGTPGLLTIVNPMGRLPTKNFQAGSFPYAEEISGEALRDHFFLRDIACFNCPVACDKVYEVKSGPFAGVRLSSVEYETLSSFGSRVWNRDLPALLQANLLADAYGLDSISAGGVIGFAMELYERGLLSREQADGLDLSWGNVETLLALVRKIAFREGIGDLLAEGVRRAAEKIGGDAAHYAMHVKGQEIAAQDGRAQQSMGLAHVTSSRGADHLKAFPTIDETGHPSEAVNRYGAEYLPELVDPLATKHKAMLVIDGENFGAVVDSSGNCKSGGTFVLAALYWPEMAEAIEAATGIEMDVGRLKTLGERIYNLQRCYNALHGITRQQDTLPQRFLMEPSPSGNARGEIVHLEEMLEEYYRLRDWDADRGWPRPRKLRELRLEEAVRRLELEG
jgi:aldehyde:ferredoxin oxidoreductase